jgi:hypothetical protein
MPRIFFILSTTSGGVAVRLGQDSAHPKMMDRSSLRFSVG